MRSCVDEMNAGSSVMASAVVAKTTFVFIIAPTVLGYPCRPMDISPAKTAATNNTSRFVIDAPPADLSTQSRQRHLARHHPLRNGPLQM